MTKKTSTALPDHNWIQTRQTILRRLKGQVAGHLGPEPKAIALYRKRVERELKRPFKTSTKTELLKKVAQADLIFGGDFHAYSQAQRTHLKILKDRPKTTRPLAIALEAFATEAQSVIDQYLAGKIDEDTLRLKSKWDSHWGFPWENYRGLIEFAKATGAQILAVGTSKDKATLEEREVNAARVLKKFFSKSSIGRALPQVYCIFGELHLGERHLPRIAFSAIANDRLRVVTIHLNSEQMYFQLAKKGLENKVDVVSIGSNRFVVLASPPWVQWQSYLLYLEDQLDQTLSDDEDSAPDLAEHVGTLMRLACDDLNLELNTHDLSVYGAGDERVWQRLKAELSKKDLQTAKGLIEAGRSFFLPKTKLFYLSRTTINHAAELAGRAIHSELAKSERPMWQMPGDFKAQIWSEAVSFFISKLVNHKRHSENLEDLQIRLSALPSRDQSRDALLLALEYRFSEIWLFHRGRRRKIQIRPRRVASQLEAARILGGMMGERLYLAMRSRNISLETIKKWMRKNLADSDFDSFYDDVLLRLGPQTGAPRTRKERL